MPSPTRCKKRIAVQRTADELGGQIQNVQTDYLAVDLADIGASDKIMDMAKRKRI
jgi:hypothetical protein